ncbi:MAG TPA: hypothetical protein VEN81_04115 [Planctomycetota bacterium]|nr:hypothetical protein [Planctomycetota bacterium]
MTSLLLLLASLQPPPQDDRTTILDGVESWYRVEQAGKNRGYVREKLERVRDEFRYSYRTDYILEVKDPKDPTRGADLVEYREVEATLDEGFGPSSLRSRALEGSGFSLSLQDERRSLTWGDHVLALEAGPERYALPSLAFYSLRQNGQLAREGRRAVRILWPETADRIDVEVTFDVGPLALREAVGRRSWLTPLTFLKPPPAGHPEARWSKAWVDKYGRLVEIALAGGATIRLVEDDLAAFRAAVTMHHSEGRDPFDKKEPLRAPTTPFPDERPAPRVTADGLDSALAGAKRDLRDLEALEGSARPEAYLKLLELWKAVREKARVLGRTDVVLEIDRVRDAAEQAWDGGARALAGARPGHVRLLQAFERDDPAALERELRALRDQSRRIELWLRPEGEELVRWIAQAEPLAVRARTRSELARQAVVVTGTVVSQSEEPLQIEIASGVTQSVRFVRDTSTASINGRTVRVGETVDGLRLEKVSTHSVTLSLRGELREVPIGK